MDAGARADAELGVERVANCRRVRIAHVERHDAAAPRVPASAQHAHAVDAAHAALEALGQRAHLRAQLLHAALLDIGQPRAQAGDAVGVQRARLQALGHARGMMPVVAVRTRTAHLQRLDLHAFRHGEAARALGAVQALVPGERHDVQPIAPHVDGHDARRLGRVRHQQRAALAAQARDAGDVVHVAGEVGSMGHRRQPRSRKRRLQRVVVERAARVVGHHDHLATALVRQTVQRAQHRIVRGGRGHQLVSRPREPGDGGVQRLGGVAGEGYARRIGRTEQPSQLLARPEHGIARVERRLVHTAAHAPEAVDGPLHRLGHLGRLDGGGGRVVEVDHSSTILTSRPGPTGG